MRDQQKPTYSKIREENLSAIKSFVEQHQLEFKDLALFQRALTHSSYSNETKNVFPNNERLEYLGDSVLGLIINEYLFQEFPNLSEGELDKMRSNIVREQALAKVASKLQLNKLLLLGKGEKKNGGNKRSSNLANALEAVIAALYLDQGFNITRTKVGEWFAKQIEEVGKAKESKDAKSLLQEFTQKYFQKLPIYKELSHTGPDHRKLYSVQVIIQGKEYAQGQGFSLKDAEQQAAERALKKTVEMKIGA